MTRARWIGTACAGLLLISLTRGFAQEIGLTREDQAGYWRSLAATQTKSFGPQERGVPGSDSIKGNGTRAGYTASHGGIVPNSDIVTVDGRLLARNRDYYFDSTSGMLAFAEPVRISQFIRVTYRYSPEKDKERSTLGAPAMALNLGPNSRLGLTFAQQVTTGKFDLLTYGLNLKTTLGAKSSMTNMMYVSSARDSGRVTLNLAGGSGTKAPAPRPKTDSLFLHNSSIQSGKVSINLDFQDVGKDFSGFSTLRQEKAAADDVLARLEKEKGIRRLGIRTDYGLGQGIATGMSWGRISDAGGEVSRQSFSFGDSRSKVTAEFREISAGFKSLGILTPGEQQTFAKEIGMRRMNLAGDFKLSPELSLKTSFSQVRAKDSGFSKYGLALAGKQFSLNANFQDIDPTFNRINDLADADKKTMLAEHGMSRYDLTAHLQPGKSITVDSYLYNAKHKSADIFKKQLKNNIVIAPSNGPKLSILMDQITSGKDGLQTDWRQQRFALEHHMGNVSLNAIQDTVTTGTSSGSESSIRTRSFHFETDTKLRTSLIGDWKNVLREDGKSEDTKTLRLSAKLARGFDFNSNGLTIRTEAGVTDSREVSLTGKVLGSVALKSRFGQTMSNGDFAGGIRELSLIPDAAKNYGPFREVKWSLGFAEVQSGDKVQSRAENGRVEAQVMDQRIAAEYSGAITKDGGNPITRTLSLGGDPDPKKPVHYNFMYKSRDPGSGDPILLRRYDFDWQISESMKFTYNFFTYNEKPDGKLDLTGGERYRLTMPFTETLNLLAQLESTDDYAKDTAKDSLSVGITSKPSSLGALEASYGQDHTTTSEGEAESHTYRLKYDHQMDADHFITFSGKYTNWSGVHKSDPNSDDVLLQLDFRTIFG